MAIYNEDGEVERYTWKDIFYDDERKHWVHPKKYWLYWCELCDEIDAPMFLITPTYKMMDYLRWLKTPPGVTSSPRRIEMNYVLKSYSDVDDFDYNGVGDFIRVEEKYMEFTTIDNLLKYLKKNIRYETGFKPKLETVEDYCREFGFEVYERMYVDEAT